MLLSDGPLVLDQCDLSERDFMASHFRCWIAISARPGLKRDGVKEPCLVDPAQKRLLAWCNRLSVIVMVCAGAL